MSATFGLSATEFLSGWNLWGRTRKPGPKGPLSCLMLVPGPTPVSQAPVKPCPAGPLPQSVYLEEKSDQQKKRRGRRGEGWPQ